MFISETFFQRGMWSWLTYNTTSSWRSLRRGNGTRGSPNCRRKNIDMALVKEFYANIYDQKDDSPKQFKDHGKLIQFDVQMLNAFLETPIIL